MDDLAAFLPDDCSLEDAYFFLISRFVFLDSIVGLVSELLISKKVMCNSTLHLCVALPWLAFAF